MKLILLTLPLLTSGCIAPLVVGGTAAVGTMAAKEKGIGGTIHDSEISVKIKSKFYKFDPDMYSHIGINVQNGDVLLTGSVPKEEFIEKAETLAKKVHGVKSVINNITVMKDPSSVYEKISSLPSDSWITTQMKSKLLVDEKVSSLNYSIKTVDSVLYIMGIAKNQEELDHVIDIASKISGVTKVVNTVKVHESNDEEPNIDNTSDATSDTSPEPSDENSTKVHEEETLDDIETITTNS